jgi:2-isopropylmalate synthase
VEFSPEDASRSEPEFLCKIIEGAISAGADVINFPDTVGCGQTEELIRLIGTVQKNVPAINNLIQSVHFHNDLGNAVTNSLYAVKQLGIRQVECAVNGAGERSGNAALEEIVANIVVRSDYYGLSTNIDTKQIGNTSRLVYRIMGLNVPYNKPIVGTNSLRHSAGIHQDGVTKDKRTYEIMTPEDWGWMGESVVISSRSGKAGVKAVLEKLGYNLTDKEVELTTKKMKELGDTKKTAIYPEDLILILEDEVRKPPQIISLEDYRVKTARRGKRNSLARAWVRRGEDVSSAEVAADGPIDALFGAINKALRTRAELKTYEVKSFTPGSKSIGEVTVRVGPDDKMFIGRASSTDIIGASGDAYVRALNKMLVGEEAIINGYISDIERQFGDAEKDARREAGNK